MKVLFLAQDFIIEPLGLMYLSSSLRKRRHEVMAIKVNFPGYGLNALSSERIHGKETLKKRDLVKTIKGFSPDILGYSVTTGMHRYYLELNREIKKGVNALAVFGGPHPTFFPEMIEEEGVDVICRGEGEEAILELADTIESGQRYSAVKNLWVKGEKDIIKNDLRPLKYDLDSIAYPDRELFYRIFPSLKSNPIKNFMASRGCPYDCSYCFNHVYRKIYGQNGVKVRYRSSDNVIEEIRGVKNSYPLDIVYFQDDTFNLNRLWLWELLEAYRRKIALPFHAHLRPDLIDEEMVRMFRASNCLSVTLAFETADDNIRRNLLKREMSKDEMLLAARLLRRYNIKFRIENIVGLPTGSIKSDWETLNLNIKARPSIGWASLYQPYPRTRLGEFCKKENLVDSLGLDSIRPSFFQSSILNLRDKNGIENLQKLFSITVELPFLRPLVRQLIKLPPNRFFNGIYVWWKRYAYQRRLYRVSRALRLLFINLGGVGDVLMTTPALRELKEKFPQLYTVVAVLAGRGGEDVLNTNPFVDELFIYNPQEFRGIKKIRLLRWMKKKRFNVTFDMYPAGKSIFDFLAFFCRIPWRIKHKPHRNDRIDNFLHNVLIVPPLQYHHQDYDRQLVYGLGMIADSPPGRKKTYLNVDIPPVKLPMEISLTSSDIAFKEDFYDRHGITKEDTVIGLHPGCYIGAHLKKWPGERFAILANRLYSRYKNRTVIFGTSEEEEELDRITGAISAPFIKVINLPLRKVAAVLNDCDLLIANESGLMHVSQAMGIPLIALFGPSNPLKVGPLNHNSIVLKTTRPLPCPKIKDEEPCCIYLHRNNCPYRREGIVECLYYLSVEDVINAVDNIIISKIK